MQIPQGFLQGFPQRKPGFASPCYTLPQLELKDVFTFLAIIWTCLLCVLNFGLGLILPLLLFVYFVARFEGIEAARKEGIEQVIKRHHPRRTPSTHLNSLQLSVLQLQNTSASLNPRPQFSLGNGCYYDAKMD